MNRPDFRNLALTRLQDAQALLAKRRFSAAYYLAGYAVECALKACVAKKTKRHDFPPEPDFVRRDCYTHDLERLLKTNGLDGIFRKRVTGDPSFAENWSIVQDWSEESRYDTHSAYEAKRLLVAIVDATNGVLECIKPYW